MLMHDHRRRAARVRKCGATCRKPTGLGFSTRSPRFTTRSRC